MTDYSTQYSSAQLTPINPSQNYSTPLEASPYNYISENPAKNVKYKTSFMCFFIVHHLVFSISGLATTVFIIIEGMKETGRNPLYLSSVEYDVSRINFYSEVKSVSIHFFAYFCVETQVFHDKTPETVYNVA